ncbi:hypothetical protein HMPREF9440_00662 [Sutterella parvirubra YIT 11816]|uniref:Uncharacterized protein n=1 Tax=Sutterella parvirubra YIT 11816 TaxID=762967 RepID=H3KD55_9BURK|nr:hypothetical protein HMPREF9440_00662 [Sutterella parvirubra YIT 11816]
MAGSNASKASGTASRNRPLHPIGRAFPALPRCRSRLAQKRRGRRCGH